MVALYSYVMTDDTGFAPNPYHGVLTLACCKPVIRRCANTGDWVLGTVGKSLNTGLFRRVVYLMRISEKLPRAKYWNEYQRKRVTNGFPGCVGDNIYEPYEGDFKDPPPCATHTAKYKNIDLGKRSAGRPNCWVLISDYFYYFGKNAVELPASLEDIVISTRMKKITDGNIINGVIGYFKRNYEPNPETVPHPIEIDGKN